MRILAWKGRARVTLVPRKSGVQLAAAVAAIGLSLPTATSAAGATSGIAADILMAIAVNNTAALNFGGVVTGGASGTVVVKPDNSWVCNVAACGGNIRAASFNVTGGAGYTYTVTLPSSSITLTEASLGIATMTVDTFNSASASGTRTLDSSGTDTLIVGATLHVGSLQIEGDYTGKFDVTVNYD
jgi:hypothetical protein